MSLGHLCNVTIPYVVTFSEAVYALDPQFEAAMRSGELIYWNMCYVFRCVTINTDR